MSILRVIDIETTGFEPPAEIIELGWQDLHLVEGNNPLGATGVQLFNAQNGIPADTMAVHHITPKMVAGLPLCGDQDLRAVCVGVSALVAHNATFEGQWFTDAVRQGVPLICTFKAALRVWPEAPAHTNSVLRYWLGYELGDQAMPPHRAQPDAYVTAHILHSLLQRVTVQELIQWTLEPRVLPKINFGKHRGSKWSEVPADYLGWIVDKSDLDDDTKWNAKRELTRRAA